MALLLHNNLKNIYSMNKVLELALNCLHCYTNLNSILSRSKLSSTFLGDLYVHWIAHRELLNGAILLRKMCGILLFLIKLIVLFL